MSKKKLISLYVDSSEYEFFKKLVEDNGSSISKEIRKMINEYIKYNVINENKIIPKEIEEHLKIENNILYTKDIKKSNNEYYKAGYKQVKVIYKEQVIFDGIRPLEETDVELIGLKLLDKIKRIDNN